MVRQAVPGDEAALDGFLSDYAATSMFLRSNLAAHGLAGSDHRHATAYYIAGDPIAAVYGITNDGMLMAQSPNGLGLKGFVDAIAGRSILGMTGVPEQMTALQSACGLAGASTTLEEDEPLFTLDLADLPPAPAVRAPVSSDIPTLTTWFRDYMTETGTAGPIDVDQKAADRATSAVTGDAVRVLEDNGELVAMAALNARVADHVQVGGVFVPQDRRNGGLGRKVTAGLLAELREDGAKTAILFAASDAAARAYQGIGFQRIGEYRIVLFSERQEVRPA